MKFGGPFPFTGALATPDNLVHTAQAVERMGYDYVWMGDHLIFPKRMKTKYPYTADGSLPISPTYNFFEIFTTYAFIAGQTSKLELSTNIVIPALRRPEVLARLISSVDVLSGGRLRIVIGLGWMEDEYEAVGVSWRERASVTDESVLALRALWGEEPFHGKHFQIEPTYFNPKPLQSPFPIWVGGDSDAAIRRAATLGEGWQPVGPARETSHKSGGMGARVAWLKEKYAYALETRERAGRGGQPLALGSSVGMLDTGSDALTLSDQKDQLLEDIAALASAGVNHVSVLLNELNSKGPLQKVLDEAQWFAEEVMPHCRDL
ncbi:MAG: TIGR03619 family F420-dependent LLM class oxidoreductase [Bradyrhizobium sp.]|nr:TIGR03619 family F420-dependent LLM class oxidoreductase [Bradyrhizobium sp.]